MFFFGLQPGLKPWHDIFYITSGMLILEAVIYGAFASAQEQEWNRAHLPPTNSTRREETIELNKEEASVE